jgi:hypothetical protein
LGWAGVSPPAFSSLLYFFGEVGLRSLVSYHPRPFDY